MQPWKRRAGGISRLASALRFLLSALLFFAFAGRAFGLDRSFSLSQFIHASSNGISGFGIPGVWALVQTNDRYICLGAEQGLIRFDGVRFVRWTPPVGEECPGTPIESLTGFANGGLWMNMWGAILTLHDGRLERYIALN